MGGSPHSTHHVVCHCCRHCVYKGPLGHLSLSVKCLPGRSVFVDYVSPTSPFWLWLCQRILSVPLVWRMGRCWPVDGKNSHIHCLSCTPRPWQLLSSIRIQHANSLVALIFCGRHASLPPWHHAFGKPGIHYHVEFPNEAQTCERMEVNSTESYFCLESFRESCLELAVTALLRYKLLYLIVKWETHVGYLDFRGNTVTLKRLFLCSYQMVRSLTTSGPGCTVKSSVHCFSVRGIHGDRNKNSLWAALRGDTQHTPLARPYLLYPRTMRLPGVVAHTSSHGILEAEAGLKVCEF